MLNLVGSGGDGSCDSESDTGGDSSEVKKAVEGGRIFSRATVLGRHN